MKLVVIGDTLLDRDVDGGSTRTVPDGDAPVVDVRRATSRAGGAGLVARLARSSGHETTLVTVLSDDAASHEVRRLLTDVTVVAGPSHCPTPVKTRVLVDGQVIARVDEGCGPAARAGVTAQMLAALEHADAIVVSDYGRGLLTDHLLRAAVERMASRVPVVWDPHPRGAPAVPGVAALTPNAPEAVALTEQGTQDDEAVRCAARRLLGDWGAQAVTVTLGGRGAWLQHGPDPEQGRMVTAAALERVDACGAGDRFASALAAGLVTEEDLAAATAHAVATTGSFLASGGVATLQPPRPRSGTPAAPERHPADAPDAQEVVDRVRAAGGVVVATGGCFDLLHTGHLRTLSAARAQGDTLIVCLNSDASVGRLKGPARPLLPQDERAELLLGLDCVDAVLIFDQDTPEVALDALRPDVWVKGGDYLPEMLPETEQIAAWGGRVMTVPYHAGRSTTSMARALEKVRAPSSR